MTDPATSTEPVWQVPGELADDALEALIALLDSVEDEDD